MEPPTTIAPPGPAPGPDADGTIQPDALTADLLRRHAAGEKLRPQEYGKLGAFRARQKGFIPGRPRKPVAPMAPGPNLDPTLPGAVAPSPGPVVAPEPAEADSLAAPAADPALVRRTTEAILETCDGFAQNLLAAAARKAGADEKTAALFSNAARLQDGPRQLMVNTSPEVLASMGLDASNYPIAAFLTGLSIWAGSLTLAVNKLKALQKEREPAPTPAAASSAAPAPAP